MRSSTDIYLFDTLQSKKRLFQEKKPGQVSVYGCGPTVYNLIHVGNARAFLTQDLLVRVFELAGYKVSYTRNYTDIDDKIIKAALEVGKSAQALADEYCGHFDQDMMELGCRSPHHRPKVSESLPEIVAIIEKLLSRGHAYVSTTPWGQDVYFRVSSDKNYGKLSKRPVDDLVNQSRIEAGESKESPVDFALWKAAKEDEPSWDSPWGAGRPGWHIECSAMIDKLYPERLDIHMGGSDLIFPHHENEIAQSECAHQEHSLANYWIHNGMVQIAQVKMSKSLGNFLTLRDFLKIFGAETLRLLVYQAHYRSTVDFSRESLVRTEALLEKLYHYKKISLAKRSELALSSEPSQIAVPYVPNPKAPYLVEAWKALCDDLNTAKALGLLLKEARQLNKNGTAQDWALWHESVELLSAVFGVLNHNPDVAIEAIRVKRLERLGLSEDECQRIEDELALRVKLRAEKRFEEADQLRKNLEARGIVVMDGIEASTWDVKASS